jgi:two-component system sensor histidine kinase KdpD
MITVNSDDRPRRQPEPPPPHEEIDASPNRPGDETRLSLIGRISRSLQPLHPYLKSLILVGAVSLLGDMVSGLFPKASMGMIYLLAVVIAAIRWGRGPSIATAVTSAVVFDFLFFNSRFSFVLKDLEDLFTFGTFLVVALMIGSLTTKLQEQAEAARVRATQTDALYKLSRDLAGVTGINAILQSVTNHIYDNFGHETGIFLPEEQALKARVSTPGFSPGEYEYTIASWVFHTGRAAGRGTNEYQSADGLYLPLSTMQKVLGVLGVKLKNLNEPLLPERRRLLESFASQTSVAIEREKFGAEAHQVQVLRATEKLQSALLNCISHDLRTPLVSVKGVLSTLVEDHKILDAPTRRELIETAYGETERLNQLVGNLLDMTRVTSGAMKVTPKPSDVSDVIGVSLRQLSDRLENRRVSIEIPKGIPYILIDFSLIVKVLVNVLDNSLKYSPPGTPIDLQAKDLDGHLEIRIADRGFGIPPGELNQVFDKFYRVRRHENIGGTGLGLSICKGIVEAHKGRIWAENRPAGGTIIQMTLPVFKEI